MTAAAPVVSTFADAQPADPGTTSLWIVLFVFFGGIVLASVMLILGCKYLRWRKRKKRAEAGTQNSVSGTPSKRRSFRSILNRIAGAEDLKINFRNGSANYVQARRQRSEVLSTTAACLPLQIIRQETSRVQTDGIAQEVLDTTTGHADLSQPRHNNRAGTCNITAVVETSTEHAARSQPRNNRVGTCNIIAVVETSTEHAARSQPCNNRFGTCNIIASLNTPAPDLSLQPPEYCVATANYEDSTTMDVPPYYDAAIGQMNAGTGPTVKDESCPRALAYAATMDVPPYYDAAIGQMNAGTGPTAKDESCPSVLAYVNYGAQ